METEAHIILDKELRRDLDSIIQRLKTGAKLPARDLADFAETLICNGVRPAHASGEEWDAAVKKWRDEKHALFQDGPTVAPRKSAERSEAILKLQEAVMWLGMDLKAINEESPGAIENPYPNSKDTSNTKIDPTADGLKL